METLYYLYNYPSIYDYYKIKSLFKKMKSLFIKAFQYLTMAVNADRVVLRQPNRLLPKYVFFFSFK